MVFSRLHFLHVLGVVSLPRQSVSSSPFLRGFLRLDQGTWNSVFVIEVHRVGYFGS
jgi:hypothetical protein